MELTPMRSLIPALCPGLALTLVAATASAGDVYVICSPGVSLQATEVREVFIGEKGFAGAVKLVPADNGAAQPAFLERVLKVDLNKYASIWTKKSFRDGASPPSVKATDAEAAAFVKSTPGACSYVGSAPPAGVTVVAKF